MNREKLHLLLAIILLALPFVSSHAEETTDYDYLLVTDVSQLQAGQEYALLSADDTKPRFIDQYSASDYLECINVYIQEFNYSGFNSRQKTGSALYHIVSSPEKS